MKRRSIHQSLHSLDVPPFEVFCHGSWRPTEGLQIRDGAVTTSVVDGGNVFEENVMISNLRIRSRRATLLDCTCYLRPGLDVCVLSASRLTESSSEDENLKYVWLDAKINTIARKPHDTGCACLFYVSLYVTHVPFGETKRTRAKNMAVQISQISILQKLERKPHENECFRWESTEDCSSLQECRLFPGKFSSDLSWAVIASVLKQISFDIRLIQNRIVYQVTKYDQIKYSPISGGKSIALNFKVENGISVPIFTAILEKATDSDVNGSRPFSIYDVNCLRRSKRRNVQPERYLCSGFNKAQSGKDRTYRSECEKTLKYHAYYLERQPENEEMVHSYKKGSYENNTEHQSMIKSREKPTVSNQTVHRLEIASQRKNRSLLNIVSLPDRTDEMVQEYSLNAVNFLEENDENISRPIHKNVTTMHHKQGTSQVAFTNCGCGSKQSSYKNFQVKRYSSIYSGYDTFRDLGTRRSCSASMFEEMIMRCMEDIKSTVNKEQPFAIDRWKEIQATKSVNQSGSIDFIPMNGEEKSEDDILWNEMELCMVSMYLHKYNEGTNAEVPQNSSDRSVKFCDHEYKLNEEIGILCGLCGHVSTEIKDVSPNFLQHASLMSNTVYEGDSDHKLDEDTGLDFFSLRTTLHMPLSEGENNVWALIPDLGRKLRFHQKRAFEFLWRNIAGSLVPALMEAKVKKGGGCVISHSPGAGKTLLIIAFLESYLKLFPGSRPLVLAPKTTLYTWYKETKKWEISIPVYQIHSARDEASRLNVTGSQRAPKPSRNCMHILDCMEKIQKWVAHPSVLLMSYTSFRILTREDTNSSYEQYMGRVLRKNPGILILDEGHNPRNTRSRLRKALMKIETRLRILLSGTLFQNNFGEYFNTLTLARPSFVNEILRELDPKFKKRKTAVKTRLALETRARKSFIDGIAKKINSSLREERMHGLNVLKNLTSGFIDVYEGGIYDNLPGLQCYTIMMKPTLFQQELLVKLRKQKSRHSGFPLELEFAIALGSVHPWLIQTTTCTSQYFSSKELEGLRKCKFDLKLGSKVRFVMSLLPRCIIKKEKILIFCHYIAPINLFVDIFEAIYGWKKGKEVLVLRGDLELFERGRVMDKFEDRGGASKVMLASITACGEGISLTAASRVILLDLEWNPSKTKQAIARAFRPGQEKVVYVYQLLAAGTLEEEKYIRNTWKERVSSMIFSEDIANPSQSQAEKIEDDVLREMVEEDGSALFHRINKIEKVSNGTGSQR